MYYYRLISSMLKAVISTLGTGLYAVYKAESNALASLTTNLYAVYKAESNANDSLGNYNGTAQGGLTYSGGKSGNAFTFNGTTAYVSLPNNTFNSILSGDFSISLWVNVASTSSFQTLFSNFKSDGGGVYHGIILGINSNQFRFQIYNNTTEVLLQAGFTVTTNTWHNIVVTRKYSTGTKIYINGTLITSNTNVTNPDIVALMYANIGAYINASGVPSGEYMSNNSKIDELNAWNKELTATEVTELYNAGAGKFYPY